MPFEKGQSGNPGGRPKLPPEIKQMLEEKGPEALKLLVKHLDHKESGRRYRDPGPRLWETAAADRYEHRVSQRRRFER
jgi:hypothetical protein